MIAPERTAPCEVCGDEVQEGLRYMAGPFAGRMFCEDHDPLRGGPRAGYPELGTAIEPDYDAMSDRDLAVALRAAENKPLDERGDVAEEITGLQNAICDRLDIPLDETELGLSQAASDRIDAFIAEYVPGDRYLAPDGSLR